MPDLSFTHTVLLGALLSTGVGLVVLGRARLLSRRPIGGFEVLEAATASAAVAWARARASRS